MNVIAQMRERLNGLSPLHIEIIDDSAKHAGHAGARQGGGHYQLKIVSASFAGLRTMQRHRLVYDALGLLMTREIHALSIDARSPQDP